MAGKTENGKRRVKFSIEAEEGCAVYVAGTFNGWDPGKNRLRMKNGMVYTTTLLLPRGKHEYKFVIDDTWCLDPECPDWAPNNMGSLNSVITVD